MIYSDYYREELLGLFESILALTRGTHIKQFQCPYVSTVPHLNHATPVPKFKIKISPVLSVEPLVTYYLKRANSYSFIRKVLLEFFGAQGLKELHRPTIDGPVEMNLYDELNYIEALFYGAALISSEEIGQPLQLTDNYSPSSSRATAVSILKNWIKNIDTDVDFCRDNRAMVPVYYDGIKDKIKVWISMGYVRKSLKVSFEKPPHITLFDENGDYISEDYFEIEWEETSKILICPVFAEIYVNKILNREEFRHLCNKNVSEYKIIDALENL